MSDDNSLIDQMRTYYDQRAPWHDWYMDYHDPHQMALRQQPILEIIRPHLSNKTILEIACGTGNWTHLLASLANHVHAIDSSPASLRLAESKLAEFKNVTLLQADAYNLDANIPSCDIIFAADWYSHIPKSRIRHFLESIHHRTGAQTGIFVDMLMIDYFRNEEYCFDHDGNRVSRRTLPDGTIHNVIKNFPTESELRDALSAKSDTIHYLEFSDLHRWLLIYNT